MSTLSIVIHPNPILHHMAKPMNLSEIQNPSFQKLLDDMIETMFAAQGIGLAAPQIGISKRIIIVQMGQKSEAFINPEIVGHSWRTLWYEEGCLSVPGVYGKVKRFRGVKIHAWMRDGKEITLDVAGLPAIIFQHEMDHLNGILFIEKAKSLSDKRTE
ncbi:MAG: Peptide deformylase [Candidatus Uhrbacteria bacterium GW2011_GWE2_46_68]|uniref:Peptide deformylase n=2 Tax=Candidatus Uhriibacteriota TaxID=1752732 RepID=A0A0G1Q7H1_9BACT|nr:MAG: Peptide deformylase [Candidatus Uhrbacteria bacterium GW2011_GWF2_46_218]KKU41011.1 MAG: Peptide deformylase [Candidatus Uhrbacteria bacterium GW2011_GWE2_46_68]